jgi:hypothetical protein
MAFKKAQPKQARLKVSNYGPPGSGKTFTTLLMAEGLAKTMGKRVAFVDTENGTDFYAQDVPKRRPHPEAFDFDKIDTRSVALVLQEVRALDVKTHGVIVIDSISHIWESCTEAYTGKRTKIDSIPMHAWGRIKKPYKDLLKFLIASPFHVFILGRQKNLFEKDDQSDELKKTGVAMRAEGETAYEPHICLRMESFINPEKTTESVYVAYVEKDRTGVLSGRSITNPDFRTIEPLLPLLGEEQAPAEDEEERISRDSDLMESEDRLKEERSAAHVRDLTLQLVGAGDVAQLKQVGESIAKVKKHLTKEHHAALRDVYVDRQKALAG